jgi:hypothetical protein
VKVAGGVGRLALEVCPSLSLSQGLSTMGSITHTLLPHMECLQITIWLLVLSQVLPQALQIQQSEY